MVLHWRSGNDKHYLVDARARLNNLILQLHIQVRDKFVTKLER